MFANKILLLAAVAAIHSGNISKISNYFRKIDDINSVLFKDKMY